MMALYFIIDNLNFLTNVVFFVDSSSVLKTLQKKTYKPDQILLSKSINLFTYYTKYPYV